MRTQRWLTSSLGVLLSLFSYVEGLRNGNIDILFEDSLQVQLNNFTRRRPLTTNISCTLAMV
jgi:hypothetical protein